MVRCCFKAVGPILVLSLVSIGTARAQKGYAKFVEPNEKAFTALVPTGWITVGGIVHWGPEHAGALNATEAKVDFTLKSDAGGTIMAHWLPDIHFVDMTGSPAAGMFRPGMHCNGCIVMPRMGVVNYLLKVVLPLTNPGARDIKVLGSAEIPEVEQGCDRLRAMLKIPLPMVYRANIVALDYTEGRTRFRQIMFAIAEDLSRVGLGTWQSRSTMLFRAPVGEFDKALPILKTVQGSMHVDEEWLAKEMQRAEGGTRQVAGTFEHIREINSEIVKNRMDTNAAIQHQMQAILTKVD